MFLEYVTCITTHLTKLDLIYLCNINRCGPLRLPPKGFWDVCILRSTCPTLSVEKSVRKIRDGLDFLGVLVQFNAADMKRVCHLVCAETQSCGVNLINVWVILYFCITVQTLFVIKMGKVFIFLCKTIPSFSLLIKGTI